ncbi:unnamed protein product [Mycena citricolor]|uniref:Uncharacterized protein n=1 Tax=Mycena citricolor TaxID=2018698 RepID=A0AAD2JZQ7_9AGAR|nr:unnamed protein product [Mycena citricolor]
MNPTGSQTSRLLGALLGTSDASQAATPARQPLQLFNSPVPEGSAAPKTRTAQLLENARRTHVGSLMGSVALSDVRFLSQSLSSAPAMGLGAGGAGEFNLNYDVETPLRAIDLGGDDQAEQMSAFVSRAIDNLSHGVTVSEAMKELGLNNKDDVVPGMEARLLPHQAIGVAWMLQKEKGPDKGGILADDMGLGKTVQMIATMVMNVPAEDEQTRTTLIVVPAALLQQWKEEIETKTNNMFSVWVHHGTEKLRKPSEVKKYDVVITTYQTLSMDFRFYEDVDLGMESDWLIKHGGVLARTRFHRVIADEAQYIRNRSTKASISLAYVRAKYRWMLTGTPVTNTLADLYGLLRFGQFRPWNEWNDFNTHVARVQLEDAALAGQRAQVILKPILLRRTKNSTLEGQPILDLKAKDIEIVRLKFTDAEREIYNCFEARTKVRVNKFIRYGTLVKNQAVVLVMILRLRQLCCHPHLILSIANGQGFTDPTLLVGSDQDKERGRALKLMGRHWVDSVKRRFLIRANAVREDEDEAKADSDVCPVCKDLFLEENGRVLPCGHEICFDCTMDLSNSAVAHDGVFGEGDESQNEAQDKAYEEATAKGLRPCPTCKRMTNMRGDKVFKAAAFEPTEDELSMHNQEKREVRRDAKRARHHYRVSPARTFEESRIDSDDDDDLPPVPVLRPKKERDDTATKSIPTGAKRDAKGKSKAPPIKKGGNADADDDDVDLPSAAIISNWERGDDDLEPSTKMLAMIDMLQEWESTGDKTIVLRFDGKMSQQERDAVLSTFKRPGGPKVILISIKCGSVGLNLVSANRIINMDLSWNIAAESQAYDRAHRIGQSKNVWVKRLVVENTIEERMLRLQDVKQGLAEAALGEGTGGRLQKLSVKEIKLLFGMSNNP